MEKAEHLLCPFAGQRVGHIVQAAHRQKKLHGGEHFVELGLFGNVPDDPFNGDGVVAYRVVFDEYLAFKMAVEARQNAHRGRFSCPVGADIANDLAGLDIEVDAVQHLLLAV